MCRALPLIILLVLVSTPASAIVIRVPDDYPTILEGVDAAASGDTVLVAPGTWTYRETRGIRAAAFLKGGITLLSEAGAESTIVGADSVSTGYDAVLYLYQQSGAGSVTIEGFTITGGHGNAGVKAIQADTVSVKSCIIRDITVAAHTDRCDLEMVDTTVESVTATAYSVVYAPNSGLHLERCVFRNNKGPVVRGRDYIVTYGGTIRDCEFRDNKNGQVIWFRDRNPLIIERNLFIGNAAPSGQSGSCIYIHMCNGIHVRYNTFVRDSCYAPDGSAAVYVFSQAFIKKIHHNLFYECYAAPTADCSAVSLNAYRPFDFYSNVIAGSRGAPAVRADGDYRLSGGCNLFWNNEGGDAAGGWVWAPSDFGADPQFCDPENLDFRVAASSPCLPENSLGFCDGIGPEGVGCGSFGTVVVGVDTRPTLFEVTADDSTVATMEIFNWIPESSHTVSVPEQVPDTSFTRYDFSRWADGPVDLVREIVTPATPTLYTAIYDTLHYLVMQAEAGGTVAPTSDFYLRGGEVVITASPDTGCVFGGWTGTGAGSYTGPDSVASVTMNGPLTQTAHFHPVQFELRTVPDSGGAVNPETGLRDIWSVVEIEAIPDPYYIFKEWVGNGDGSYSGTNNPALVTMNGPITQGALFQRISHEVALSLSDTDPGVSTGPPLGFGSVYLWVVCSTDGGLKGFEGDLTGTMPVLAFTPAPGILNAGDATHLELASPDCLVGPTLLGTFFVQDDGGGSLCFVPSASHGFLGGYDCSNPTLLTYEWPADMRITGVATDGSAPCDSGRPCGEDATVDPVGVVEPSPEPISHDTAFEWSRPNPFSIETELRFSLSQPTHVTLSIYDVAGRLVRRLVDEERGAGRHGVTWAGRDADNRPLPAGVYFSQLVAGDFVQSRKLVLMRGE